VSDARADEVLAFWFGPSDAPGSGGARKEWFVKDEGFDAQIRERFGALIESALAGGLEQWLDAPETALAYVILLDQFTRNAFRDTPASFAGDARALAAARLIVARGWDTRMTPVHRWFCYLPFEHSERIEDQHESLRLFGLLRDDPVAGGAYEWAVKHCEVIERFGRYPHRNAILGRASTPQELAFLAQPGSRF
jgi:uncharacterized protein (DUF924 family)